MFIRFFCILLVLYAVSTGCTKSVPPVEAVMALQQMNELATVEYIVTKIIKANDNQTWYKLGNRKIVMSCRATLTAGINLSLIKPENVRINGTEIELSLPHATLISLNIKPEDIAKEYETVSILRNTFSAAERNELAVQAENQIRNSVNELGILTTAETNASLFVNNFLSRLGYKKISIRFNQSNPIKN